MAVGRVFDGSRQSRFIRYNRSAMIYLDYNASTPIAPEVREAMLPYLGEHFGNPSSGHGMGKAMKRAVERARGQVAMLLNADAEEIVFTSGGTEGCNHVIKGVAHSRRDRGRHIMISAVEHPAVVESCRYLAQDGYEITTVGVDSTCLLDPQVVAATIRPDTILISIMHANNEVGTIQPIAEIAKIARERGVLMHTDAAQSCGKIKTDVMELGVDFLTIAGHKMYAPQGIGAMYIRSGVGIDSLHHGAGHERGRRAGTEPVANIVALGAACELARKKPNADQMKALRDRLHDGLRAKLGDKVVLLGHPNLRLPNTLNVGVRGELGDELLARCPDLCATTGAACHTGTHEKSGVLAAMKVPNEIAFGAIRLSVGRMSGEAEVESAIEMLIAAANR